MEKEDLHLKAEGGWWSECRGQWGGGGGCENRFIPKKLKCLSPVSVKNQEPKLIMYMFDLSTSLQLYFPLQTCFQCQRHRCLRSTDRKAKDCIKVCLPKHPKICKRHAVARQSCEFTMKKPPHGTRTTLLALPPCSPSPDESASPATLRFSSCGKWENSPSEKTSNSQSTVGWFSKFQQKMTAFYQREACGLPSFFGSRPVQAFKRKKKYGILQSFWHNL